MARTIHNDGSGGIKFCDCCTECTCANCQGGTVSCPNVVGRIQGEDLQSAHATDVTSGGSFPTFVFDDAGFASLTVEVTSVQYPVATKTFEYRGETDTARRDNLKADMEAWFELSYGGDWTFDVQISGSGLLINSVSAIASVTNISEMFFYEDTSGSHESDHTDFVNVAHVNACVTAALTDTLWTTGAVHSGTTPCTYVYNAALGSGCGNLVSTISVGASVISLTVQINDDQGEVVSAVFQSNTCAPFECDSEYGLQIVSFNAGEDPNTNTLVDWTGATATYAAGEPAPSVVCTIPTPPDITALTMLGDVVPCGSCTAGDTITVPLGGLISGTNLLGSTTFEIKDYDSFNTPEISGSSLLWDPFFEDTTVSVEVQATNNGIKDSASIIFESPCCGCSTVNPTITTDTSPPNPCVVPTVVSYTLTDPCVRIIDEYLRVTHAGGVASVALPLPGDNLNLDAYAGETVTLTYTVVTTCGTETVTEDVTVGTFNNTYTVDPGSPASATNFQVLTDGIAAMSSGDKLIIEPGTYTLNSGGEGSRADFNNLKEVCVTTSTGIATIDASLLASGQRFGNMRTSRASGSYFANIEVTNGSGWAVYSEDMGNAIYENISVNNLRSMSGNGVDGIGMYIYNADNVTVIGGTMTLNEGTGVTIDAVNIAGSSLDTKLDGVTSTVNNQDGIQVRNSLDAVIQNSTFSLNKRSGMVCIEEGCVGTTIRNSTIFQNEDAGIQFENGASNFKIINNLIEGNNTYITGGGGEAGLWIDQCDTGLIEYNEITQNDTGIRIGANLVGSNVLKSNDIVVRYNRVYDNNAQITNDYAGNEASMEFKHSENIYVYHNTFSGNGNTSTSGGAGKNGIEFFEESSSGSLTGVVTNSVYFLNNIVTDVVAKTGARNMSLVAFSELDVLDGNIYFGTPDTLSYEVGGVSYNYANYEAQASGAGFERNSFNADPELDADLAPASTSPAIGNALYLATVTTTIGTTLGLDYPGMFLVGDIIEFEDGLTATVSAVGPSSVTVNAIPPTVQSGQGVRLYTCDGSDDIGAVQIPLDGPTSRLECATCTGSENIMPAQASLTISGVTNIPYPSNTSYWDFLGQDIAGWINQNHTIDLVCEGIAGGFSGAPAGFVSRTFEANNYSASNSGNNPYDVEVSIWMAMQLGAQWRYSIFVSNVNSDSPPTAIGILDQTSQYDGVNNGANCLVSDSADSTDLVIGSDPDRYLDTSSINITMIPLP